MAQFCAAATGPAGRFAWSIIPPPLTGGAVVDLDIVLCRQLQQLVHAEGARIKVVAERGDQHASLRGLISTWLEIAVNALLSLDQDDGRELAALEGLAAGRENFWIGKERVFEERPERASQSARGEQDGDSGRN